MSRPFFIDLKAIARQSMASYGFLTDFPVNVVREVQSIDGIVPHCDSGTNLKDMRSALWSSIDNIDSLDFDQVEYCQEREDGDIRVRVAIADVDAYVLKDSATDERAAHNGTSVYTGVETFPMIPTKLSHDLSSLKQAADRLAVVIDYTVRPDGTVRAGSVYRALINNHAKLVYEPVGEWLEGKGPRPEAMAQVPGLEEQLRLQDEAAQRLHNFRRQNGAIELEMVEAKPVMEEDTIVDLIVRSRNQAHRIIENFMIAANGVMVNFLKDKGAPSIQRIVRTPERWPRILDIAHRYGVELPFNPSPRALSDFLDERQKKDPEHFPDLSLTIVKLLGRGEYTVVYPDEKHEGHFGLAVTDYTHSTAPNRRYVDLIIQRLIKSVLARSTFPYRRTELQQIAAWCSERDQFAKKVERFMRKVAAAVLLSGRIGEVFEGIVTGASEKGVYVRLITLPAEGRIVRGEQGLDVGEKLKVRLRALQVERGFIDFERVR